MSRQGALSVFFILALLLCGNQTISAQPESYRFARITTEDGLSNNQVRAIMKDSRGFIWIGTFSGLNRFDGHKFKIFKREPYDSTSLVDNVITELREDKVGNIWIKTYNTYCMFDPIRERFVRFSSMNVKDTEYPMEDILRIVPDMSGNLWYFIRKQGAYWHDLATGSWGHLKYSGSGSVDSADVSDIIEDTGGRFWIVHYNGILEKYDIHKKQVILKKRYLNEQLKGQEFSFNLYQDKEGELWIYTRENRMSLVRYNPTKDEFSLIKKGTDKLSINSDLINGVVEDLSGNIWIGTDHGGINILNKKNGQIDYVLPVKNNEQSLSQRSITNLYGDSDGIIWIGTYKQGINFYHDKMFLFNSYVNDAANPHSLSYNDVNCFCEDARHNLLIGTNGGGLNYFDRQQNRFRSYTNNPQDKQSLSNDVVVSLLKDSQDEIWIGTYYGGLNKFDGVKFKRYLNDPENIRSISDNRVWDIFEDSKKNLWIGTLGGGLLLYDKKHDAFLRYSGTDSASVRSEFIIAINEDSEGRLWAGTSTGVYVINWSAGIVEQFSHSEKNVQSLSNDLITALAPGKNGCMWVGTRDGLNLYNSLNHSFVKFRTENGLPDNLILSLVNDEHGNLWFATPKGISRLKIMYSEDGGILDYALVTYDKDNGIINQGFNERAAYKTSAGELVFGGANGFYIFQPDDISQTDIKPLVYIVDFEVHGEALPVDPSSAKRATLHQSILYTHEIDLDYSDNIFSIEFAALAYLNVERIKYRYILEGFNHQWLNTDYNDRKVTYTNLDPGRYTFRVQAYLEGNDETINEATLSLLIHPPWWKSMVAFIGYGVVLAGLLLIFHRVSLVQERLKFQNEQARIETSRQQELNAIKTRFFTNISHEFRTPLTLIISPLERLKKKYNHSPIHSELEVIYLNARRLLGLINQLLDFRKMEEQRLSISLDYGNVIKFLGEVFKSFDDLAASNEINFGFTAFADEFFMRFDEDKLEKVLFNLLSNAFKFTSKGGDISVEIGHIRAGDINNPLNGDKDTLLVVVRDSGIGIPKENHHKVFERFFQNKQPTGLLSKGSGVGLSLTQEFVKLHGGIIKLESEVDRGSSFFVYLPINQERIEEPYRKQPTISFLEDPETQAEDGVGHEIPAKSLILLVEDNEDFRFYLRDNLRINYQILEAASGQEALQKVESNLPDLIVSDLMMPNMSGIELCQKIKNDEKTSHIPFILLTASLTKEMEVEGFKAGTDAYLTKPFSFEILESRIRNLLLRREKMKKSFQKNFEIEPGAIGITSLDEKLMKKALKFVEDNLTDTGLSVEKLSHELGFSRVHFYKKMVSITGKTPVEFIRLVRLKRSAQLLRESQLTISEIAYQVGFSDPRYFSKIFKAEFKQLPSQYKAEHAIHR